jgi:predicted ester cyclase
MSFDQFTILVKQKYESLKQSDIDKSLCLFPAFSNFTIRVERQIMEGNRVTSYWKMSGLHTGEYVGIAPSGKPATLSGVAVDEVRDGRIIQISNIYDFDAFLVSLKAQLPA